MKLPVNEKNLKDMQLVIESIFTAGEKTGRFMRVSIYKVYFTNVKAM